MELIQELDQKTASRLLSMVEFGTYYGYPPCCIDAFLLRVLQFLGYAAGSPDLRARRLNGTGFIPCRKCHVNKKTDQILAEIKNRRLCKFPFQQGFQHDQDSKYFKKFSNDQVLLKAYRRTSEERAQNVDTWLRILSTKQTIPESLYPTTSR